MDNHGPGGDNTKLLFLRQWPSLPIEAINTKGSSVLTLYHVWTVAVEPHLVHRP